MVNIVALTSLIAIEFVSGDGSEERDATSPFLSERAKAGKFWVYEQAIRISFYAIYDVKKASVEVYELVAQRYQLVVPNSRGHYPISPLGVELGIWQGRVDNQTLPWLRWWDSNGSLLLTGEEQAEVEKQRAEVERQRANAEEQRANAEEQRADAEKQRADRLAVRLREMGIDSQDI
jgi:hypothetical protein